MGLCSGADGKGNAADSRGSATYIFVLREAPRKATDSEGPQAGTREETNCSAAKSAKHSSVPFAEEAR